MAVTETQGTSWNSSATYNTTGAKLDTNDSNITAEQAGGVSNNTTEPLISSATPTNFVRIEALRFLSTNNWNTNINGDSTISDFGSRALNSVQSNMPGRNDNAITAQIETMKTAHSSENGLYWLEDVNNMHSGVA